MPISRFRTVESRRRLAGCRAHRSFTGTFIFDVPDDRDPRTTSCGLSLDDLARRYGTSFSAVPRFTSDSLELLSFLTES